MFFCPREKDRRVREGKRERALACLVCVFFFFFCCPLANNISCLYIYIYNVLFIFYYYFIYISFFSVCVCVHVFLPVFRPAVIRLWIRVFPTRDTGRYTYITSQYNVGTFINVYTHPRQDPPRVCSRYTLYNIIFCMNVIIYVHALPVGDLFGYCNVPGTMRRGFPRRIGCIRPDL